MPRVVQSSAFRIASLAAALLASACGAPPDRSAETILARWFESVQSASCDELARVDSSAPAERSPSESPDAPTEFDRWCRGVEQAIDGWVTERETGRFTVDPRGYALVRAAKLGRGVFWQVESQADRSGATELVLRLNFGYGEIPFGTLPRGTTVYLLGYPLGTVHALVLGRNQEHELDLLEHAWVSARLVPGVGPAAGDAPLKVESIRWAGVEPRHATVRWVF